jgi:hypothetical protein
MSRPAILVPVLATCGAVVLVACTQDFDLFEASSTTSGASSAGGGVTSSSASGSGGAGGTTTNSSSSSSSAGGVNGAGGTGGGLDETCNDGNDNDNDNEVDCADTDCADAGYTCVDAEAGWTGPIALFEGAAKSVPSCPSTFPDIAFQGFNGLSVQNFACNACACNPAVVTCTPADPIFYSDMACIVAPLTIMQATTCQSLPSPKVSIRVAKPAVTVASSCIPTGGGVVGPLPTPVWMTAGLGCAPVLKAKGCSDATTTCTPPLPAGFDNLCVYKTGDAACPAAFPQKRTYYDNYTDSRACASCACGAPNGAASCTVQTTVFANNDCSGAKSVDVPNDGTCFSANGLTGSSFELKKTVKTSTCQPSSGAATGSVAPDPLTITTACCKN